MAKSRNGKSGPREGPEKAQTIDQAVSVAQQSNKKLDVSSFATSVHKLAYQSNGLERSKSQKLLKFWLPLRAWLTD